MSILNWFFVSLGFLAWIFYVDPQFAYLKGIKQFYWMFPIPRYVEYFIFMVTTLLLIIIIFLMEKCKCLCCSCCLPMVKRTAFKPQAWWYIFIKRNEIKLNVMIINLCFLIKYTCSEKLKAILLGTNNFRRIKWFLISGPSTSNLCQIPINRRYDQKKL